jgi:hypothetical protein
MQPAHPSKVEVATLSTARRSQHERGTGDHEADAQDGQRPGKPLRCHKHTLPRRTTPFTCAAAGETLNSEKH